MKDLASQRADLLQSAVLSLREEAAALNENWRSLDGKAQGTGAIAGIFLAAGFAWAREIPATFGPLQRTLLAMACAVLIVAVTMALLALRVRNLSSPPQGKALSKMIDDLLPRLNPYNSHLRLEALLHDQIVGWTNSNEQTRQKSIEKASWVRRAQWSLIAASALVAIVTVMQVIN